MKHFKLLIIFALFSVKIFGQSIFLLEFNYIDNYSPTPYQDSTIHALIFYYDENSKDNKMRLYYKPSKNKIPSGARFLGEQRLTASKTTRNGVEYLLLKGDSATNLLGGNYFKDDYYIECSKDAIDGQYYPESTWIYPRNNASLPRIRGDLTAVPPKLLTSKDITDPLLRDFGIERKPDDLKAMNGSTLHLLLVTHSGDADAGEAFRLNNDGLRKTFQNIAAISGMKLKVVELSDTDFRKQVVADTLKNYTVGTNDVLVFYYSGHGFRLPDQTSKYPYLLLRSNFTQAPEEHTLLLEDIYKTLERKKPRLLLVVGECCNIGMNKSDLKEKHSLVMRPSASFSLDPSKVKKLFGSAGKIFVASCSPGERSAYRTEGGGLFFNNLRSNIYSFTSLVSDKTVSWEAIIARSVENTEEEVNNITGHTQVPMVQLNMK